MKWSTVPLLGLLAANALSMTGNVAALVAIPWYVLQTTGSASKTGLSAFFNFLPVALAGFLGGTVVDRFGFKSTSVVADLASGLSIASIPLLHATIGLEYWQLLLLIFLGALLDTPGTTARAALIPEAAMLAEVSLERATSLADAVNRFSTMVGGPLAGLLIVVFGASNVLWVDAATFALSAFLIGACIPRGLNGDDSAEGQSSYLEDLSEGFSYLRRDHLVLSVLLVFTGSNFLDAAFFSVILPFFAQVELESAVSLGLIVGASGAGALLGAIAYGWIGHALSRRHLLAWGLALHSIGFLALAPVPPIWVLVGTMFASGMGVGPLNPVVDTVFFERVPLEIRGRVLGMGVATAWFAMPLGVLSGGFVVEWLGVTTTALVSGGLMLALALSFLRNSHLQQTSEEVVGRQAVAGAARIE